MGTGLPKLIPPLSQMLRMEEGAGRGDGRPTTPSMTLPHQFPTYSRHCAFTAHSIHVIHPLALP